MTDPLMLNIPSREEILYGSSYIPAMDSKERIQEIPIDLLTSFREHPFKVIEDEDFLRLEKSIEEQGILVPIIVRAIENDRYEIISGHRRSKAALKAGLKTVPAILIECNNDDAAVIMMVDSNIQRKNLSYSEKARAYSMKYRAMKHQGVKGGSSLEEMAKSTGESMKTIQRYMALSRLIPELMDMVDKKILGFGQAVDISSLSEGGQMILSEYISENKVKMTGRQSKELKSFNGTDEEFRNKLCKVLSNRSYSRSRYPKFQPYFIDGTSDKDIEETIICILTKWSDCTED